MSGTGIDRVLADLDVLAAEDSHAAAPPAVGARVLAAWDAQQADTNGASVVRWWNYAGLVAVSATVALLAGVVGAQALSKSEQPFAVVEFVGGSLDRIVNGRAEALGVGQKLAPGAALRATSGTGSQLVLADGSRVEMRPPSQLSLERAADGLRIHLTAGDIIVHAARQRTGHLYVQTRDLTVSVVGTVFLVNAEDSGSRVAVVEGEVQVQHGTTAQRLRPGQQVLTGRALNPIAVQDAIGWSRRAAALSQSLQRTAQRTPTPARPEFDIADVHVSPRRGDGLRVVLRLPVGKTLVEGLEGAGGVRAGRLEIHDATMLELIRAAYGIETRSVLDGPSWLDVDRFDVIAKPPARTTADALGPMLQSLLADRFGLVVRQETRALPAWVLANGPREPKLTRAQGSGESSCRILDQNDGLACRGVTMDAFAARLRGGILTTIPVVNATGVSGPWDFDLHYSIDKGMFGVADGNPILDAVQKQLGLRLERRESSQPVLVVVSVNRTPTANDPDLVSRLPPAPIEFEAASIRPCTAIDPRTTGGDIGQRTSRSGQVATGCRSLLSHIKTAWDLCPPVHNAPNMLAAWCRNDGRDGPGAPEWLTSKHFNIVAAAPIPMGELARDRNYQTMLRNLLVRRFSMVTHYEDRVTDIYALVTDRPRLQKADPSDRTGCQWNGPFRGASTAVTCQNVTMAQFAEELHVGGPGGQRRVVDETGLQGTWDIAVTFGRDRLAAPGEGAAPEPAKALPLREAIEQQLGLKLVGAKRPLPIFVIDHVEDQPTEN